MIYKISEGFDHFNGYPLFQVVGVNNDFVGEWCSEEADALTELRDLQANALNA